jgi:drug/metabolite transporter (DMT)-like permease
MSDLNRNAPFIALLAAAAFGLSTPLAKFLLGDMSPWALASLLYLGSGIGLGLITLFRRKDGTSEARLSRADMPWLLGTIFFGGIAGPILLLLGLTTTDGASASLLLNLEAVFTLLLAWLVFKEHVDTRLFLGAVAIVAGAVLLGFVSYGLGLVLFIMALRLLGTARTGAYYGTAPFIGALAATVILGDTLTPTLVIAGLLMAFGAWLHFSERHAHDHQHDPLDHSHRHTHDEHHQHEHGPDDSRKEPHSHTHHHAPLKHAHAHYPDIHHRHRHS